MSESVELPPCRKNIFENGKCVYVVANIPAVAIEEWVKGVALLSGQDVDWHYVGGRGVVRALGDITKVREAIAMSKLPEKAMSYAL